MPQNDIHTQDMPKPGKDTGYKPATGKDFDSDNAKNLADVDNSHVHGPGCLEHKAEISEDLAVRAFKFLRPHNKMQNSEKFQSPEVHQQLERGKRGRVKDEEHDRRLKKNKEQGGELDIHDVANEREEERKKHLQLQKEQKERAHKEYLERLRQQLQRLHQGKVKAASLEEKALRYHANSEISNFVNKTLKYGSREELNEIRNWLNYKLKNANSIDERNEIHAAISKVASILIKVGALDKEAYVEGPHKFEPWTEVNAHDLCKNCQEDMFHPYHGLEQMYNPDPSEQIEDTRIDEPDTFTQFRHNERV